QLVSKQQCLDAMSDLAITVDEQETTVIPLFEQALGADFHTLPQVVQDSHQTIGTHHFDGRASVRRGTSTWSRLIGWVFRFPQATDDIAVKVTKTANEGSEVWIRKFGDQSFRSELSLKAGKIHEQFGHSRFCLDVHVADGALHFPVASGKMFGVPLPNIFQPESIATEREIDGKFQFDVQLLAPFTGVLIVHYQGWLEKRS
ncbi:MAG: DUF4166 domain-containing protein, partial [Planktomarina sp.]